MRLGYLIAIASLALAGPVRAQSTDIAELYRGKTVTFMINFTPGGSTDVEGRVLARHLGDHIPGKPTVVVQNMGGAGGSIGTNYLGQVAKPDGLMLGYLTASVGKQALGEADLKVDLRGLEFLGNVPDVNVTYMRKDVQPGISAPADIMKAKGFWIGGLTPDAAGIPARPFHEFYESVKGQGSLPSDLRWQAYMRINQLSTSFLRVLMMPPKTSPAIVAMMRQALQDTFADPVYRADARQTFNNVPQFKTGETQKQALLGVLGPRPGVQEFIADYIAKGFRSVGDKK